MRLLEVTHLTKHFTARGLFQRKVDVVHAVDDVSLTVDSDETLALVGESGCGKTTVTKLILRLLEPTAGDIFFDGIDLLESDGGQATRRRMQMIFQNPLSSLNPRKNVRSILSQPFLIHNICRKDEIESRVSELLALVEMSPPELYLERYPHELSGGQRQRVCIARAVALHPDFIAADEPVSALDMSVRAQILNLIKRLKQQSHLAMLFVTHDLAVVRSMADRVAVMYLGKIVEASPSEDLFDRPMHPYTQALLSVTPIPNPRIARTREKIILKGDPPSPINLPVGCRFQERCPTRKCSDCRDNQPQLIERDSGHFVACHCVS